MFGRSTLSYIFVVLKFDHGLSQSRTCRSRGRGVGLRIDQASRPRANRTNLNINMLEMVARRRIRVNHHACAHDLAAGSRSCDVTVRDKQARKVTGVSKCNQAALSHPGAPRHLRLTRRVRAHRLPDHVGVPCPVRAAPAPGPAGVASSGSAPGYAGTVIAAGALRRRITAFISTRRCRGSPCSWLFQ